MSSFDSLAESIKNGATLDDRIEALLSGLAERIKATSNDQNVQKLSRELKAAAPAIVRVVAAGARV